MRNMGRSSAITFILVALLVCSTNKIVVLANHDVQLTPTPRREAWDISIGSGGITIGAGSPTTPVSSPTNCPTPPPPPEPACPPPPTRKPTVPPPSPTPGPMLRIDIARKVIQEFRSRVTIDPYNITKTWDSRNACDYTGFKCAFLPKYNQASLYSVQFNGLKLDGPNLGIDNFIEKLPDVSIFHANSNNFKGNMPVLSNLPYLFELDLSNNKFVGGFPNNVLGATKLTFLDIRFNFFTGRVPPQLFNMDLLALFINNNKFLQEIPPNLGSTPVAFLTLSSNNFIGKIPKSIGQAANTLLEVLFLNNKLSGCLPYEIGLLKKARVFDVSYNQLTGRIPHSFACLAAMEYLVLSKNQFYGTVPEMVCKLPLLANFSLSNNYFTEVGPECMKLVRKKVLDVNMNCILGLPNQRSPKECQQFFDRPKYCSKSNVDNYIPCKSTAGYLTNDVANYVYQDYQQPHAPLTYGMTNPPMPGSGP